MPESLKQYVVRQGDTLLRIALSFGVEPEKIWDEAKNAELKQKRDPDILAPGDILFVPPPPAPTLQLTPKQSNKYKAKVPEVEIALAFENEEGKLADEEYVIEGLPEKIEDKLDGNGELKVKVPVFLDKLTIKFPKRDVEHAILVGHLDPLDQPTGVQARLAHLAFLAVGQSNKDPYAFADPETQRRTVIGFQEANGLEGTGFADQATQDKIRTKHRI